MITSIEDKIINDRIKELTLDVNAFLEMLDVNRSIGRLYEFFDEVQLYKDECLEFMALCNTHMANGNKLPYEAFSTYNELEDIDNKASLRYFTKEVRDDILYKNHDNPKEVSTKDLLPENLLKPHDFYSSLYASKYRELIKMDFEINQRINENNRDVVKVNDKNLETLYYNHEGNLYYVENEKASAILVQDFTPEELRNGLKNNLEMYYVKGSPMESKDVMEKIKQNGAIKNVVKNSVERAV